MPTISLDYIRESWFLTGPMSWWSRGSASCMGNSPTLIKHLLYWMVELLMAKPLSKGQLICKPTTTIRIGLIENLMLPQASTVASAMPNSLTLTLSFFYIFHFFSIRQLMVITSTFLIIWCLSPILWWEWSPTMCETMMSLLLQSCPTADGFADKIL